MKIRGHLMEGGTRERHVMVITIGNASFTYSPVPGLDTMILISSSKDILRIIGEICA
jgi:hypothetical protein